MEKARETTAEPAIDPEVAHWIGKLEGIGGFVALSGPLEKEVLVSFLRRSLALEKYGRDEPDPLASPRS